MCIRDRAIPPHLPETNEQNLIVIEAFLEAAKRYARGGYDVIVDGIIGCLLYTSGMGGPASPRVRMCPCLSSARR